VLPIYGSKARGKWGTILRRLSQRYHKYGILMGEKALAIKDFYMLIALLA
jgi:hypothetical protein